MSTALVVIVLLAAHPSGDCCATVEHGSDEFCVSDACRRHIGYHKRLYYGHFDRHPFDYRFQFDYPWHAGPSQSNWPIPPLPPVTGPWHDVEFQAQRPSSPRVTIATKTAAPRSEVPASRTSLKLRIGAGSSK